MTTSMTRRSALGMAVAGLALATGCRGGIGTSAGTMNLWGAIPADTGPDALVEAFMADNPGQDVVYTRYLNDDDGNLKLDTGLTGGVPIDVFFQYRPDMLFKRVDAGLTLDLTEYVSGDPELAAFLPGADPLANYVRDGSIYAIPAARSVSNVYLNEAMLDAAGIKLESTWTVSEFRDVAKELTRPGKVFGTLGTPEIARSTLGPDYHYSDNGTKSNLTDPAFRTEIEVALEMQREGVAMDHQTILAQKLETYSHQAFLGEKVAMIFTANQLVRYINDTEEYPHDFTTRIMPPPIPDGVDKAWNTGQYGDLIAINPKTSDVDAAWQLLQYWVKNAGSHIDGRIPSVVGDATEDVVLDRLLGENAADRHNVDAWRTFLFENELVFPIDTIFTAAREITDIKDKLRAEVLLGTRSVDSWVAEATAQADAAIEAALA